MFTRLLFLLLSLLRQPVGEARDGLADLILRYCEAQTHELAAIDRIMVDARSCRHAGFEQQFAAEGQAVGAEIADVAINIKGRSEEHTSELQSLMRISYAVFCLKKKKNEHKIVNIAHGSQSN